MGIDAFTLLLWTWLYYIMCCCCCVFCLFVFLNDSGQLTKESWDNKVSMEKVGKLLCLKSGKWIEGKVYNQFQQLVVIIFERDRNPWYLTFPICNL